MLNCVKFWVKSRVDGKAGCLREARRFGLKVLHEPTLLLQIQKGLELCQLLYGGCTEQDSEAASGLGGKVWRSPSKSVPGTSQQMMMLVAPTQALESGCSESQGFLPSVHLQRSHGPEDEGQGFDGREEEGGPDLQVSPQLRDPSQAAP